MKQKKKEQLIARYLVIGKKKKKPLWILILLVVFFNPIMLFVYAIIIFEAIAAINITKYDVKIDEFHDGYYADSSLNICDSLLPYQEFYKDYDYLNIDYHYYRLGGKTLNLFTDNYEYAGILLTFDEDNYQKAKKLVETYNEDSCLFSFGNYVFYDKFIPHYTRYTINENIQINWIVFTGYSDGLNSIFFGGLHFLSEHNELLIIDDWSYLCTNVFKDFSFE